MAAGFELRGAGEADLDAVMQVQAQCYPPSMQEPRAVVLTRIRAARDTALVASGPDGVCAYVFAYASTLGSVTPLDSGFSVAAQPDTLYLHDLAVSPAALGKGLGKALVARLFEHARSRRLAHTALVSVQDSQAFWMALGYRPAGSPDEAARAALATYPGSATYMTRRL
jgi:ribosomal protein S18 acetylase RimI-like enzyme